MESSEIRQRTKMKFRFKLGKTATETHELLVRVYRDAAVSRKTVYKWFERYHGGPESTEDNAQDVHRLRQQRKTSKINEMVRAERRL
jgi:hypothetical protein